MYSLCLMVGAMVRALHHNVLVNVSVRTRTRTRMSILNRMEILLCMIYSK